MGQRKYDIFVDIVRGSVTLFELMGLDMYIGMRKQNGKRIESIGSWRKANAIHAWFVDKVQNGVDECQLSVVTREQASELLNLCYRVLYNPKFGVALLPTRGGFFFGSTAYDEAYQQDLQDTVSFLEQALAADGEIIYQSNW